MSLAAMLAMGCATALAHVQVFVPVSAPPSAPMKATTHFEIRFLMHAADNGPLLPMAAPTELGVIVNAQRINLLRFLNKEGEDKVPWFSVTHTMTEPAAHVYYLRPAPFWDKKEGVMITHCAKVILNSTSAGLKTESELGWENWEGWDQLVGFPVEIEPLQQPTAFWAGSVFRGVVLHDGKPAPATRVEVEYYDREQALHLPSNAFKTQILKTDTNGVFAFVPVHAGWWSFSAIRAAKEPVQAPDGTMVPEEQGGVFWLLAVDMN
jgi:cobalt/nickel transport protein